MSYSTINEMWASSSLRDRIVAASVQEGVADADAFFNKHFRTLVTASDWVTTWEYARDTYKKNMNPDTGVRDDVISDAMILSAVQAAIAADAAATP